MKPEPRKHRPRGAQMNKITAINVVPFVAASLICSLPFLMFLARFWALTFVVRWGSHGFSVVPVPVFCPCFNTSFVGITAIPVLPSTVLVEEQRGTQEQLQEPFGNLKIFCSRTVPELGGRARVQEQNGSRLRSLEKEREQSGTREQLVLAPFYANCKTLFA